MNYMLQHRNATKEIAESSGGHWIESRVVWNAFCIPRVGDSIIVDGAEMTVVYVAHAVDGGETSIPIVGVK